MPSGAIGKLKVHTKATVSPATSTQAGADFYSARFNVSLSDWARTAKDSLPQKYKAMYGSTILKESSFIQSVTT